MGIYESILGSERETRKSAFDIIHFAKKLTFAGLKKYSIVQERFEKKSTLWGGGGGGNIDREGKNAKLRYLQNVNYLKITRLYQPRT